MRMMGLQLFKGHSITRMRCHVRPARTTTILQCSGLMRDPITNRHCCRPMILNTTSLHCCKHQHQGCQDLSKSDLAIHILDPMIWHTIERHLTTEGQDSSRTRGDRFLLEQCSLHSTAILTADHSKGLATKNRIKEKTATDILLPDSLLLTLDNYIIIVVVIDVLDVLVVLYYYCTRHQAEPTP